MRNFHTILPSYNANRYRFHVSLTLCSVSSAYATSKRSHFSIESGYTAESQMLLWLHFLRYGEPHVISEDIVIKHVLSLRLLYCTIATRDDINMQRFAGLLVSSFSIGLYPARSC